MNKKLEVKDLINVGIFTALYIVCYFAAGMLGYIPIFMALIPLICPIVAGIPFMLFTTKVEKFGMITIMGTIMGIFMFATGHMWPILIFGVVFGILGDLVCKIGDYREKKWLIIGYAVFSEWCVGAVLALFFIFREDYFIMIREGYGDVYADKLYSYTPNWLFFVMIVLAFLGGILGALLGAKVLKKHFRKAGIA